MEWLLNYIVTAIGKEQGNQTIRYAKADSSLKRDSDQKLSSSKRKRTNTSNSSKKVKAGTFFVNETKDHFFFRNLPVV
jgi:hypothetical protein